MQTASGSTPHLPGPGIGYSRKGWIPGPLPRNDTSGLGGGWYWIPGPLQHPPGSLRLSAGTPHPRNDRSCLGGGLAVWVQEG